MTRHIALLAVAPLLALPHAAQAQETRASVEVAGSTGYSNNPFVQNGASSGSGFVSLDVTPRLQLLNQRSTFTATLNAHVDQYFTRYPTSDSYRASLAYNGQPSERITTFARVDLSSAIIGSYDNLFGSSAIDTSGISGGTTGVTSGTPGSGGNSTVGTGGGGTVDPGGGFGAGTLPITDIGLLGTRDRRRSLHATGGLAARLSEHDTVNASAFGDFARYRNTGPISDYDGYGGTLGYSRQLSTHTSLGVQGSASRYQYKGPQGNTNVYSVQATGSSLLSAYWTVQGSLGVSFTEGGLPGSKSRTSLSGQVNLCRRGQLDTFCFSASRGAQATGLNGAQYITTLGANWNRKLSERTSVGANVSYVTEGGLRSLTSVQSDYLRTSVTLDRRVLERLRIYASARYRQVFGGTLNQSSDYGGQIGARYIFGRQQ